MNIHSYFYSKLFDISKEEFDEKLGRFQSCAIVGNSGILSGSNYGKLIDKHDRVVRFNDAPTEGYENDVGSKTDFRFLNVLHQRGDTLSHTSEGEEDFISKVRNENVILKSSTPQIQNKAERKVHESCDVLKISRNYRKIYPKIIKKYLGDNLKPKGRTLSLGMQGILIFLPLSDQLDLFGFNLYQSEDPENYHYWEEFTKDEKGPHSYSYEDKLLEEIKDCENVRLFE